MTARTTPAKSKKDSAAVYDGAAPQRIPIEVIEGSSRIETAHHVGPVTDAIYLEYIDSVDTAKLTSPQEGLNEIRRATKELFRTISRSIENIENDDYVDLVDAEEVEKVVNAVMNVSTPVGEPLEPAKRNLDPKSTVKVITIALFNGRLMSQSHELIRKTDEHRKKYDAIQEGGEAATAGSMARAKGQLYKQICVKSEGFKGAVPLRFQVRVIDHHFRPEIDLKK